MALAFLLFGAFLAYQASQMSMRSLDGGPGPGLLPAALGGLMIVFSARLLLEARGVTDWRVTVGDRAGGMRLLVMVAMLALYASLLERLGFVLATVIMTVTLLVTFNERHRLPLVALGLIGTAAAYWVFYSLLKVQLPPDPWGLWR